jgi:hypothetical protein
VIFPIEDDIPESLAREIPIQPVLEPWREVGRPKGLCAVKGDPIPWVVQLRGRELVDWDSCRKKFNLLWVILGCEWKKRDTLSCGFVAPTRG